MSQHNHSLAIQCGYYKHDVGYSLWLIYQQLSHISLFQCINLTPGIQIETTTYMVES